MSLFGGIVTGTCFYLLLLTHQRKPRPALKGSKTSMPLCWTLSIGSIGSTKQVASWCATSFWVTRRNRLLPRLGTRCYGKARVSAPIRFFEAGVRQHHEWADPELRRHILVAVARYLAAHAPTERAWLQTADIARRLSRGDQLHENA